MAASAPAGSSPEGGAAASGTRAPRRLHLRGHVLLGPDHEVSQAWVLDGRLTLRRPRSEDPREQVLSGWILPGLVDAHCHVGLDSGGAVAPEVARVQAETDRDAGALLLRDAGSPADTRWIDDAPDLPVIVRAGRHIARPRRYLRHYAAEVEPEELVAEVRRQAGRSDGWVKLVADWIDRDAGDLAPCWPADALREAVAAAHEAGARVTAHCFGEECLPDLLAAGIDCLEHATGLAGDDLAVAGARGVAVVPTLVNTANFLRFAEQGEAKFPRYAARMRRLHAARRTRVREAWEAGCPVYVGTDAGGHVPHGLVATEMSELVAAGLTSRQALDAGCWAARAWLGRPGLEEGERVDAVVLDTDPRLDVRAASAPTCVVVRGVPRTPAPRRPGTDGGR